MAQASQSVVDELLENQPSTPSDATYVRWVRVSFSVLIRVTDPGVPTDTLERAARWRVQTGRAYGEIPDEIHSADAGEPTSSEFTAASAPSESKVRRIAEGIVPGRDRAVRVSGVRWVNAPINSSPEAIHSVAVDLVRSDGFHAIDKIEYAEAAPSIPD